MKAQALAILDVVLFTPAVHGDDRGFFMESFNVSAFEEATGFKQSFVQDNHSRSQKGVLWGPHYQLPPHAQGKLVRVTRGAVFDVAVDIRRSSPSFGLWVGHVLSEDNKLQLWIPPGFAHGFLTLSDTADFLYKTTDLYTPQCERSIALNDRDLAVEWPYEYTPGLSEKDLAASTFKQAEVFD